MRSERGQDKLTCARARDLLPGLAAGELGEVEAQQLRAHLAECAACRARLAGLEAAMTALHEVPTPQPPQGAAEKLIAQSRTWAPVRGHGRPWWLPVPALTMGAAASVLVGLII
ncbi:MAG: zf-HC2 domain-containing protein, partial [Armatimonadetes bacterium]|nr:zf-HC2 domain-containing protein [Armatimonadota bacterium]